MKRFGNRSRRSGRFADCRLCGLRHPIPLYGLYRTADGLTYTDLSLSSVVYFVGAVSSLLFFGRISDHLGRRVGAVLTISLMVLAAASFMTIHSAMPLLIGRLLQGLSCGLASTALAARWSTPSQNVPPGGLPYSAAAP